LFQKNSKKILFLTVIILLAVLVFPHPVKATVAGVVADFLGFSFTSSTLGAIINGITTLILNLVEQAISFFAGLFDKFIQWQTNNAVYGVVVVDQSWTIIRNFVNMFFILILIIMAFGTIFDLPNYKWQHLLAPFLIAALLVNFSLTIGQYIITIANGLSGIFLKQIGQISGTFAQGFNAVGIATSGATDLISGTTKVLATSIFAIIFLSVVMLAFAAAAIFSLVRIFVLWFLLIISPIAWLGYSLPNLRKQTWSDWWKHFFCWCFFLPYYLFFVMFAVIFVKNRGTIPPVPGSDTTAGMTGTDFLFYALSLIFLIGGLVIARKMACASGTGLKTVFGKIEGGVRKYAPGAGYVRAIGAGAKAGIQAKGEQIQEKGIPGIIGGAQAARLRQAKWTERFGFGAARGAADRAKAEETEKEFKKVQGLNLNQNQLLARMQSAKGVERVAALKLRAENGWLAPADLDEINRTMRELGGGRNVAGTSLIQSLKKGKFHEMARSTAEKERIFNGLTDAETQKAFGLDMAEGREITSVALAKKLLDIYAGDTQETKKKVEDALKNNIENMAETKDKASRDSVLANAAIDPKIRKLVGQTMADKKEIDSWKLRRSALEAAGGMDPASGDGVTAEGRELAKNIKDGNVLFKEEGDYRTARGIVPTADLTSAQRSDVQFQIMDNVRSGLITGLSTEELDTPEIHNALYFGTRTPDPANPGQMLITPKALNKLAGKKPDRKKREAVARITGPGAALMPY
jgi:hypothetical protein